jgi:transcription antitermination factor NusG
VLDRRLRVFATVGSTAACRCIEGGEALLPTTVEIVHREPTSLTNPDIGAWYALWTHSHCEQLVHDQLEHWGFKPFLPTVDVWSRRRGVRRLLKTPMFPGYLFLRHRMDKESYLQLLRARGLTRILGERWDRLAEIPECEMNPVQAAAAARCPMFPFPYLREGQRVRITRGPLTGIEGSLVESRPDRGLLVLSVHLLQRSVAMSIDATTVTPC